MLTSLEIRNLLLETLAYEDNDIDSEGKTFKKYSYQGGQSDLYRLAENLAIKRNLIQKKINVSGAAWGGSGYMLWEGSTTNFTRNELLKMHEEFHYFIIRGIISPGAYGNYGYDLPYFHVTEYGKECLKNKDILPYDPDGYLGKIKSISNVDEWLVFYISEALLCYNAGAIDSSTIMVGLAGERVAELVIEYYEKFLVKNETIEHTSFEQAIRDKRYLSAKYVEYERSLANIYKSDYRQPYKYPELHSFAPLLDIPAKSIYATFVRLTRNELAHPGNVKMDRIECLSIFISFINYCETQYKYINYFSINS